jgi:guanosine-3',5'-bis(diphosphate) 3'-pyrophosphohydrolase
MFPRISSVRHQSMPSLLMPPRLEEALCWAAECHLGQTRRGEGTPYIAHVVAVAIILDRSQFDEDTVIAGLLHDVVEDTPVTVAEVAARFGSSVAEIVRHCSEKKTDELGIARPWLDRKRDHIAAIGNAPLAARAVVLADKMHNLLSIEIDLLEGRPIWSLFHAQRAQVLWYYHAIIDQCGQDDLRIVQLAQACRELLSRIEAAG